MPASSTRPRALIRIVLGVLVVLVVLLLVGVLQGDETSTDPQTGGEASLMLP